MQNPVLKRYAVLYKDWNGEVDTQHLRAIDIDSAGGTFKEENKHCGYSIVAIAESAEGCNMYIPRNGEYVRT